MERLSFLDVQLVVFAVVSGFELTLKDDGTEFLVVEVDIGALLGISEVCLIPLGVEIGLGSGGCFLGLSFLLLPGIFLSLLSGSFLLSLLELSLCLVECCNSLDDAVSGISLGFLDEFSAWESDTEVFLAIVVEPLASVLPGNSPISSKELRHAVSVAVRTVRSLHVFDELLSSLSSILSYVFLLVFLCFFNPFGARKNDSNSLTSRVILSGSAVIVAISV